ncbi:chromosomal replication initiator protein [Paucidesulfovibrio gracilis DSM 16080]|uniref:Chromosomal replication initiator protein DnaA n=1 Tax=Paucidesulfovibrio gracilis DSM 16080 TaxID=1121449 RepID=A0A1T4WCB8_9BACT|nr:chromosomal replication initiator protein DnaA [Paucidesulfovibrio gracilis]SKA74930.1 chromosomal replication initiator protein [Paucidesulfovibrio gracilis DSM 16080]
MIKDVWNDILKTLEKSLNPGLFTIWIRPLSARYENGVLTLLAPNDFVAGWVRDRLLNVIADAALQTIGSSPRVEVKVDAAQTAKTQAAAAEAPTSPGVSSGMARGGGRANVAPPVVSSPQQQMGLPIVQTPEVCRNVRWRFRFEDFVTGPSNELALAASKSMCHNTLLSDHLFLCSSPGLGKTHLLHSIGRGLSAASNRANPRVACLNSEQFASRFVMAMRANELTRFKAEFREAVDVLLLEDVHFFQGKEKMQDELLGTLKALQERGCKVVLTSSFRPKELSNVDSQLVSRICSGFMAVIGTPDFETRRRIVLRKAEAMGAQVSDDVSNLLAERITKDIRQLEGCLNNLVLKARLLRQNLSMELAWDMLDNYTQTNPRPDYDQIINFVCRTYGLTQDQLRSKSRKQQVVLARDTAFFLARNHTDLSLAAIGERLGRRHSTVIKGITKVEREISSLTPLGRQLKQTVERMTP